MHCSVERETGSFLSSPATSWGPAVPGSFSAPPSSGPPRFERGTKSLVESLCLFHKRLHPSYGCLQQSPPNC
ncbi:hypothetical protein E2C01_082212 [Portunus trituberculatus]|uniref:Uncharacterized protein n=1 Tax=Portunus trituberculatus TaxID=210409 RepID=A0A5B7IPB3_PORTR|nr:hypothetical protein [Portunus trituberculatus]